MVSQGPLPPAPLEFKPGIEDAARRWEAYYCGEIIDRPLVVATAPREGGLEPAPEDRYVARVFGDLDDLIDRTLSKAQATYYAGEAIPAMSMSFGPDEVAVFCGGELRWSEESKGTNWSVPFIDDWSDRPELRIQEDNPLWKRMLDFYRRAADKLQGKMLLSGLDLHTNMDLIAAIRGPERLCMDLIDCPHEIDKAMDEARALFRPLWDAISDAGRMRENGYFQCMYSMEGAAMLQCDFSCMISPEMFRRWVLPALEEEASIVQHAFYHWDGPDALVHTDDLLASKGLRTFDHVRGAGSTMTEKEFIELCQRVQAGGKAVSLWGSTEAIKRFHKQLRPELVLYQVNADSPDEADALLDWLTKNT